ncbi:hypothetical protein [Pseudomonas lundensis]|uniref:hypothetical protein n=1 Tax=Pseudomonas lundensis TaxID=86185 RepID=UPI000BA2AC8F|nr:hypothetical protein [Pseudomonas lundensis]OZY32378.1 hypothetical protein CJF36_12905 [Pseudomonas lundensis]
MTRSPVGSSKKGVFSQSDHLAPLAIPTGELAEDVLGSIWRKNDVFMDVGLFAIGQALMVLWVNLLLFLLVAYFTSDREVLYLGGLLFIYPVCLLVGVLRRPTPLPARFNRQRREVCVPINQCDYWIVPWETVIAQATEHKAVTQVGRRSIGGGLMVVFKKPETGGGDGLECCNFSFACGSTRASKMVWECMRSYMEIGPDAVDTPPQHHPYTKGVLATYWEQLGEAASRKGWPLALLWEGFFGVFVFNVLFISAVHKLKLNPPPELTWPEIVEWSKPIPPEQWAKRSPELEAAIAQREAELALRD